ncbi:MAG TPA: alpha-hydroxy acid oxidase [Vicinamibacterales bacterium]|nr:alpha-hydroxy acid oxidase [Vicinamibacterales bacterium]
MSAPITPVNPREFEAIARSLMSPSAYDYYAGGANDEITLAANERGFSKLAFRPRVLTGVDEVDTSTTMLGTRLPFPVALAPTAFNRLGHPDGEIAAARAAAAAGTLMCCSTIASTSLEDIALAAPDGARWFQLYVYRDREVTRDLIQRAEASGYRAIVLTVDTPRLGRRERDVRVPFNLPDGVSIQNLERYGRNDATRWGGSSSFQEYVHRLLDASLTWESVDWLCATTTLPVVIKGVIAPSDGEHAIEHGAAAVVVSNHGGRQLDGTMATIDALPAVAHAISGRIPILLDGGVRRGTDVLKAIALGAKAVLIGRPYLWALAAQGEAGVARVLEMFRSEIDLAMALAGVRSVGDIGPGLVERI